MLRLTLGRRLVRRGADRGRLARVGATRRHDRTRSPPVLMTRRALEALSALALVCPMTAVAQVGHPPQSRPYHDIHKGSSITFIGGYFMGNGGRAGVGPRDGYTFGARFDFHAARPLEFGLGVEYGALQRNIVDPTQPPGERVSGPVDQNVTFIEGLVTFNITGGKTW